MGELVGVVHRYCVAGAYLNAVKNKKPFLEEEWLFCLLGPAAK